MLEGKDAIDLELTAWEAMVRKTRNTVAEQLATDWSSSTNDNPEVIKLLQGCIDRIEFMDGKIRDLKKERDKLRQAVIPRQHKGD